MADVASTTEVVWGSGAAVASDPLEVVWEIGTLVTSQGGAYTPGAAPPGSTPTSPNTDADFVIGPGPFYFVVHDVEVVDLRDSAPVHLRSANISCDDASVCWTLSAEGDAELFDRFTTGETPVIEVSLNGNTWRFVIEGVQRSRQFGDVGVSITGRSPTIIAGEPYQFPQNWVNDGPATAQQIAAQAQVFTGLEVEFEVDDWLVPDRAFTFTGSPLSVVARVAESIGAVLRADRVDSRISIIPRYRALPNEWRDEVPNVEIHLDVVKADSYERADKPAFDGVYVSGQADGQIARVYLAGTAGDKLAPMVTDPLLTEEIALRQRGESILGQGGPQAVVRITLPVLNEPGFPGVFEINWLCRVVEPGVTWYGVVRAVSVTFEFGRAAQTITIERHTADIEGTTVPLPPGESPPELYLAWRVPITDQDGAPAAYNSNSGTAPFDYSETFGSYYAVVAGYTSGAVVWSGSWTPAVGDPAPEVFGAGPGDHYGEIQFPAEEADTQTSRGTFLVTATLDGVPLQNRLRMVMTETSPTICQAAWSSEPNP